MGQYGDVSKGKINVGGIYDNGNGKSSIKSNQPAGYLGIIVNIFIVTC